MMHAARRRNGAHHDVGELGTHWQRSGPVRIARLPHGLHARAEGTMQAAASAPQRGATQRRSSAGRASGRPRSRHAMHGRPTAQIARTHQSPCHHVYICIACEGMPAHEELKGVRSVHLQAFLGLVLMHLITSCKLLAWGDRCRPSSVTNAFHYQTLCRLIAVGWASARRLPG
jgi:hypothetical protein